MREVDSVSSARRQILASVGLLCGATWGSTVIPTLPRAEPASFDVAVRRPGRAFLAGTQNPTTKQFRANSYWKNSAKELYAAYTGICAYSCFYIMPPPGTTDHFLPKSTHPQDAYEWSNFRLCSHRVNGYKGDSICVIDPFVVQPGWFVLDFPSCLVRPGLGLAPVLTEQIEITIAVLKLNQDDFFVQERCNLMVDFAGGHVTLDYLTRRYPFLAAEILRQGLVTNVGAVFKGLT